MSADSVLEVSLSEHDFLYIAFQVCTVKKSEAMKQVNTYALAHTQFKRRNALG